MSDKDTSQAPEVDADHPVEFIASAEQLETVFSDWLRREVNLTAPVAYEAAWAMHEGKPVLRMRVWPVPNVLQFPSPKGGK